MNISLQQVRSDHWKCTAGMADFFFGRNPRINRYFPKKSSYQSREAHRGMNYKKVTLKSCWFILNSAVLESSDAGNTAIKISLSHLAAVENLGSRLKWANANNFGKQVFTPVNSCVYFLYQVCYVNSTRYHIYHLLRVIKMHHADYPSGSCHK